MSRSISAPVIVEKKSSQSKEASKFFRKRLENIPPESATFVNLHTPDEFCQYLLINGYVQSYVDFYKLTHKVEQSSFEATVPTKSKLEIMTYLQQNLISAEVARRQGNTQGVYTAYKYLADFYVELMDWKTSIFFHEKFLEVAQLTNDIRAEMAANHEIGVVYQEMSDIEISRKYHEKHEELAHSVDLLEEVSKANSELCKVYLALAQRLDNSGRYDEALAMYHQCLSSAKKCWDKTTEGEANGKIGNLLLHLNRPEDSIVYLSQQSQISADLGFAEGRCRACSGLALAYDRLGKHEKALAELTLVHTISEQAGDTLLQAQACKALGTLYSKLEKLEEAVDALQKHFTLVKTILQKGNISQVSGAVSPENAKITGKDLDMARIYLGISKGNLMIGSYVNKLKIDLSSVLDWKLNRSEL